MKKGVYPLYDLPQVRNLRELVELKYRSVPGNTAFSYLDKAGQKVLKTFRDVWQADEGQRYPVENGD